MILGANLEEMKKDYGILVIREGVTAMTAQTVTETQIGMRDMMNQEIMTGQQIEETVVMVIEDEIIEVIEVMIEMKEDTQIEMIIDLHVETQTENTDVAIDMKNQNLRKSQESNSPYQKITLQKEISELKSKTLQLPREV